MSKSCPALLLTFLSRNLFLLTECSDWYAAPEGSCYLDSLTMLNIALAFGGAIAVVVYAAASFSGELLSN